MHSNPDERREAFEKADALIRQVDAVRVDPLLTDSERTVKIADLNQRIAEYRTVSGPKRIMAYHRGVIPDDAIGTFHDRGGVKYRAVGDKVVRLT